MYFTYFPGHIFLVYQCKRHDYYERPDIGILLFFIDYNYYIWLILVCGQSFCITSNSMQIYIYRKLKELSCLVWISANFTSNTDSNLLYTHIYMFTYMSIYKHIYVHIYAYIRKYICSHICMFIYKHICICSHICLQMFAPDLQCIVVVYHILSVLTLILSHFNQLYHIWAKQLLMSWPYMGITILYHSTHWLVHSSFIELSPLFYSSILWV